MAKLFTFPIVFLLLLIQLPSQEVADRIIAVIDGEIILKSDLESQVQMYAVQHRVGRAQLPELREQILESLINKRLLLAQAVRDSIVLSDAEINQQFQNQIRFLEQNYGSLEEVAEMLGMSVPRLRREIRGDIRRELMVHRLQSKIFSGIDVSRREVEEFYNNYREQLPTVPEQVRVSHIFKVPEDDIDIREMAYNRAAAIRDSLLDGMDFSKMAQQSSADRGSAERGGDLGWVRRGVLVPEFEEAAFALDPGEISEIVETQFGLHIIRLMERRGDSIRPQHILVRLERTEESDLPTLNRLNELREKVLEGKSFSELAINYSQDADTAPFGGDLGLVAANQLDSDLRRVVDRLKQGEISEPARVSFGDKYGYSIIKLHERIPEHSPTLEKDFEFIEEYAVEYKTERKFQELMEKLRREIYWEVLM